MIFFHGAGAGQERTRAYKCQLLQGFRTIEQRFPKPQVACSIHAGGTVAKHLDWSNDCFLAGEEIVAFQPIPTIARFVRGNNWRRNDAPVASPSHGFRSQDHRS